MGAAARRRRPDAREPRVRASRERAPGPADGGRGARDRRQGERGARRGGRAARAAALRGARRERRRREPARGPPQKRGHVPGLETAFGTIKRLGLKVGLAAKKREDYETAL